MNIKQAAQKAYKATDLAELENLLAEQSRWSRKFTIARNKLEAVHEKIGLLATKLAKEKVGVDGKKGWRPFGSAHIQQEEV